MAGTFMIGETKVRPGAYFNIQRKDSGVVNSILEGVTAVIFRADFGPLNKAVELDAKDGYENLFGTALTTDTIKEAINGGAKTIIACRVGNGGTKASVTLQDSEGTDVVHISAKYPGEKEFMISIREKLEDASKKECMIYSGTQEFEKLEFAAGEGEVASFVKALESSKNFSAQAVVELEQAVLQNVSQKIFTKGSNPTVTTEDYSNAFAQTEAYEFNTICVDTEDTAVHLLLEAFINRIFDAGLLVQAVVAEKHTTNLETRQEHAAAFNDEKMNYILNAHIKERERELDGYQTAARIAGMIGACSSNTSLTHTVINGFIEILERLTNTQMIAAEKSGCIVFSYNKKKKIWIDNAVNTLVEPDENQDDGWKKIRRVKARFELIRRIHAVADDLIGKIDNDANGRSTVVSRIQEVGTAMVEESKLVSCNVSESATYIAEADSAWFDIDIVDKDSMEHIYFTFKFQFNTSESEE